VIHGQGARERHRDAAREGDDLVAGGAIRATAAPTRVRSADAAAALTGAQPRDTARGRTALRAAGSSAGRTGAAHAGTRAAPRGAEVIGQKLVAQPTACQHRGYRQSESG
jgi:hypothetical protein